MVTLRHGVSAYIMPYRNSVLTAKHVATLDALSGGRLILGLGTGWLREEFDALDVPFAGRGRRTSTLWKSTNFLTTWSNGDY